MKHRAAIAFFATVISTVQAFDSAYTPKTGSAEREAIMDAMRLDFYPGDPAAAHRNANGVLFEVIFLKVHGDWACTLVRPIKKGGGEFAPPRWGLLRRTAGQWSALDYMEALRPFSSEEAAQGALGMNPSTVARLRQIYRQAPADIFPAPRP